MRKLLFQLMTIVVCSFCLISCGDDDKEKNEPINPITKKEVKPEIANISSATTTADFTVTFRVKSVKEPNVTLYYSRESSKTSNPSLNKVSSPKCVNVVEMKSSGYSWYYYTTTHTGYVGGNYIYYQISASNNSGQDKSAVKYCIIKR